jgi:hypothetical protein
VKLTNLNYNRPSLKTADNIKKAIAEIEFWYSPEKAPTLKKSGLPKKEISASTYAGLVKNINSKKGLDESIHTLACCIVEHVKMIEKDPLLGWIRRYISLRVESLPTLSSTAQLVSAQTWRMHF